MIDRADFPSSSDRPSLPADDLTFDVILFLALAATTPGLFRDRAVRGTLVSLAWGATRRRSCCGGSW